jgi:hypothetical protein
MEFHIDIAKIVAETLEKYPLCFPLKREFENSLQTYFEGLKEAIEDAEQVGGLHEVKAEYKGYYETVRRQHKQDWSIVNDFEGIKRHEATYFAEFQFFKSAIIWLNKYSSEENELKDSRPLAPYFRGDDELDLALKAAFETQLLNDAGKWAHLGDRTKAVSIFWKASVTTGLAKADAPVYKVTKAMKEQFLMDSLGPNAIDKKKEIADFGEEYKELYKRLLKIMRP